MTGHEGVFALARDRDAAPTIRGFVYQVEFTITRWLELGPADVLELERGEDIDRIVGALAVDAEAQRLLEQVKHREAPVTLRSTAAKEALANFFEHRRANLETGIELSFLFTTNAGVGRERGSPLPARIPAIHAWEQLRSETEGAAPQADLLFGLRALIESLSAPAGFSSDAWAQFMDWTAHSTDVELLAFVRAFEWATSAPSPSSLHASVRQRLLSLHLAEDAAHAERIYCHLFHAVFDLLSKTGTKRLGAADLLDEVSRSSDRDARLAERLEILRASAENRLDALESRVATLTVALATTDATVEALARQAGISATFDMTAVMLPPAEPPEVTSRRSMRAETVRSLLAGASQPAVIQLSGTAQSGKTQLALLLAQEIGGTQAWIRLRGRDATSAGRELALGVAAIAGRAGIAAQAATTWNERCAAALMGCSTLVVDELPIFRAGDPFGMRFLPLVQRALAAGVWVVAIDQNVSRALGDVIAPAALVSRSVPALTASEVGEVLRAYGAPAPVLTSDFPTLIAGIARGHPTLVQAIAQFLAERRWSLASAVLGDLFRNHYAEPINNDTIRDLMEGIDDPQSRELLYRLRLVGDEFDAEEMHVLASVNPGVSASDERFAPLIGPWVETRVGGRYVVSPLVGALRSTMLSGDVERACHRALGRRIVARTGIGETEAVRAITHFIAAGEESNAGLVLLQALRSMLGLPSEALKGRMMLAIWRDAPIPVAVGVDLSAMIRAHQAVLSDRQGTEPETRLSDLDELLDGAVPPLALTTWLTSMVVASHLALGRSATAARYLSRALRASPQARDQMQEEPGRTRSRNFDPDTGVWLVAGGVRSADDLTAWVDAMRGLPPETYRRIFASALAPSASRSLADRITLLEYDKPRADQQWRVALERLHWLENEARAWNAEPLVVACAAARLSALGESGVPMDEIQEEASAAIAEFGHDGDESFLIASSIALAAVDREELRVALDWFRRADSMSGTAHRSNRVRAKLRVSQLVATDSAAEAFAFAKAAVALATSAPSDDGLQLHETVFDSPPNSTLIAQSLGELAIAAWAVDDRDSAARAILAMIDCLVSGRDDEDEFWKATFVTAGHVSGYFVSQIVSGARPKATQRAEPYVVPYPGMLLSTNRANASLYDPVKTVLIGVQAMLLADEMGYEEESLRLAQQSVDGLRAANLWSALTMPLERLVRHAILTDQYEAAFDYGIDLAAVFARQADLPREETSILTPSEPPRANLGTRQEGGGDLWRTIDDVVLALVARPIVFRVSTLLKRDPLTGRATAMRLRDACMAQTTSETLPPAEDPATSDAWLELARLAEDFLLVPANFETLRRRCKELYQQATPASNRLTLMGYIALSMHPSASIYDRLQFHMAIAPALQDGFTRSPEVYESVVLNFFEEYWRRSFEEARALFRAPRLVDPAISDALTKPVTVRLQFLLKAVAEGLSMSIPSGAREWIDSALAEAGPRGAVDEHS